MGSVALIADMVRLSLHLSESNSTLLAYHGNQPKQPYTIRLVRDEQQHLNVQPLQLH